MVGNNQKCLLKVFTVRVMDAAGVQVGVESGWLPITYHFGQILLNLFSQNGSIKVFNFHGIIPCSSKGVDCAISHDFRSKFQGLANILRYENLVWNFLRDRLDRIWWNWYGWRALVKLRRFRLLSGFLKNFDIFCWLCLSATVGMYHWQWWEDTCIYLPRGTTFHLNVTVIKIHARKAWWRQLFFRCQSLGARITR